GQAGNRLTALIQQHPGSEWPQPTLLETYCSLAVCHWKAGRAAQAERTFQDQVRPLAARVSKHAAGPQQAIRSLGWLSRAAGSLEEAKHPAALAVARAAAALAERYAETPARDLELCEGLALRSLGIAALLCRLEDPAESLRQAECARRLY